MITFPNAKINLGLYITGKRPDGFHNLESIFYPLHGYHDVLEFIEAGKEVNVTRINLSGIPVDGSPRENLCLKAYNLLKKDYKLPTIIIHLHKNIPTGAGLGGGSSDGAFMLKALNNHFELMLDDAQLEDYANQLGSDCPFFIKNKPAIVTGKGDIMNHQELNLTSFYCILLNPGIHVGTKEAYQQVKISHPTVSLDSLPREPLNEWKNFLINSFEEGIMEKYEKIKMLKNKLYEAGALYASMTGSGSSVYGIFEQKKNTPGELTSFLLWKGHL